MSRRCLQASGCEGLVDAKAWQQATVVAGGGVVDAIVVVTMDMMLERAGHRPECSSASACKFCKSTMGPIIWHTLHLMFSLRHSSDLSCM